MTRTEHLLTILAEECAEVAQRCSKALRFGMTEVEPGQPKTNAERIAAEMADLYAAFVMLAENAPDGFNGVGIMWDAVTAKREKVAKYLAYSAECGTLTETPHDR